MHFFGGHARIALFEHDTFVVSERIGTNDLLPTSCMPHGAREAVTRSK